MPPPGLGVNPGGLDIGARIPGYFDGQGARGLRFPRREWEANGSIVWPIWMGPRRFRGTGPVFGESLPGPLVA